MKNLYRDQKIKKIVSAYRQLPTLINFLAYIHLHSAVLIIWLIFEKFSLAAKIFQKLTQHIANRPPQLFLWPKYTFPVHYWSSCRLLKNLFVYQKIEKFTSYIASRWPQFFGLYTSFKCIIYRLVDFWKICTVSKILKKFASYNAICLLWFTSAGKSLFLY